MAQVDVYVDPDATGAGDGTSYTDAYTSQSAAEAAEATNLVTDGDFMVIHCRASSGTADTTSTTFTGWTTGASNYIEVLTDESEATGRHDGTGTLDTSTYRMNVTGARCIYVLEEYFRVTGLQLFSSSTQCIRYGGVSGVGDFRVEKTLFSGRSSNFTGSLLELAGSAAGTVCKIKNNIFADHSGSENQTIMVNDANIDVYVFANTFKNCNRAIRHLSVPNSSSYENNVINAGDAFIGSGFTAGRNWISQNTNEVDANGDYNCSFTWDSTNTYQLDSTATQDGTNNNDAIQGGADLSSDSNLPVTDDFAGTDRSATPDAGGHEVTVSSGVVIDAETGAVVILGEDPSISAGTNVSATKGSVSISGLDPSVSIGTNIDATKGALTVNGLNASISAAVIVSTTIGSVGIEGLNASISAAVNISPSTGEVSISGFAASITAGISIAATKGAVAVAGLNPSVDLGILIQPETGAVVIDGKSPVITSAIEISATLGAITIQGLNPFVDISTIIRPGVGVLEISGLNTDITTAFSINPTLGEVSISGLNATVSLDTSITPNAGTIEILGLDPVIDSAVLIEAETGAVIISGIDPFITVIGAPDIPQKRIYPITGENRIYVIPNENRIYSIT